MISAAATAKLTVVTALLLSRSASLASAVHCGRRGRGGVALPSPRTVLTAASFSACPALGFLRVVPPAAQQCFDGGDGGSVGFFCSGVPCSAARAAVASRRRLLRSVAALGSVRGGGGIEEKGGDDKSPKKDDEQHSSERLSIEGAIYMTLLSIQFGVQPSLVKAYTPQGVVKSSVVLAQELTKFVISCVLYFGSTTKKQRSTDLDGISLATWVSIAMIPAALYNVQNIASLLAYQNLEPLTFNVLNQTKTLSAALCCYLVIGRKQSRMQMASLLLLLISALIIENVVTLSAFKPPFLTGFGGLGDLWSGMTGLFPLDGGSITLARHVSHGVFPILLASFISGLAGALVQKNLQGGSSRSGTGKKAALPRNPYLFNMELNSASAILLLFSMLFTADGKCIASSGFFAKWTPRTFIPILTNSVGGIIVALVTKHAGSVRKGFALIFGILISGVIQAEAGGGIGAEQVAGGLIAALSLYLHTVYPYQPKPARDCEMKGP